MNLELVIKQFSSMKFRQAVWLFPIVYTLHVLEELPQFTNWVRRYANPAFSMREYLVIHVSGIVVALLAPLVLRFFRGRAASFVFLTFIFTPAVCFNILFHVGATAAFGVYSPGLLTALTLYPPLFYFVTRLAFREGLLTDRIAIVSFALAGAFHAADVSHNVFKAW
ncbi:MAG TPA: HXXEE domain-containing protein [Pyrinomonadaceae bacterium]